uniref:hypothetical protein n=1 Tax=Klebsiella pneumoniae TaxID=573 RepID=UPI001D0D9802
QFGFYLPGKQIVVCPIRGTFALQRCNMVKKTAHGWRLLKLSAVERNSLNQALTRQDGIVNMRPVHTIPL